MGKDGETPEPVQTEPPGRKTGSGPWTEPGSHSSMEIWFQQNNIHLPMR